MPDKPSDLVQGTLDMLILKTLALEPRHGYGIAVRLEQMSQGVFRVNAGSLFVAFQRLERAGLMTCAFASFFPLHLLFNVTPYDPGTLALIIPARRVMKVDPLVALRHE